MGGGPTWGPMAHPPSRISPNDLLKCACSSIAICGGEGVEREEREGEMGGSVSGREGREERGGVEREGKGGVSGGWLEGGIEESRRK